MNEPAKLRRQSEKLQAIQLLACQRLLLAMKLRSANKYEAANIFSVARKVAQSQQEKP